MDLMANLEILRVNLVSPLVIAFLIGICATLFKSELEFPQPVLNAISIYLVFSIGIKGGTELAGVTFYEIWRPVLVTLFLVIVIPFLCYGILRKFFNFDIPNAAALAALYGSVSSVTFIASLSFAEKMNQPTEAFMPVLASLMEWGILVALFIAKWRMNAQSTQAQTPLSEIFIDTLKGRSVILLMGGLFMGYMIGESGFKPIKPVFEDLFRGILVLFLLEMGMVAARQLREFAKMGKSLLAFGIIVPLLNGILGVTLGSFAGLSIGGSFVLGAITASSSYIDAPAAVRAVLPQANPSIYLTSSLGITFPFNLTLGLPMYYQYALWLHS